MDAKFGNIDVAYC